MSRSDAGHILLSSALTDKDRTFFRINHRVLANRGLVWSWLAMLLLAGCAGSSTRLLAPARPAIDPAAVRIYRTPPQHYQKLPFWMRRAARSFSVAARKGKQKRSSG